MFPLRNFGRFIRKAVRQPVYAARVFWKRSQAYAAHAFGKGVGSPPEAITLFLTHKCNLRCKMCGQWGDQGTSKELPHETLKGELPIETMKNLIDQFSRFRPGITLFGGEPLIYPDCVELIRYIKSKGMHCLMITNAAYLHKHLPGLAESGLDELNVSLDGGQVLHDRIRGMDGLYGNITGGLKELQRLKKEKGLKTPLITLNCTINEQNYHHLEQLLDAAREIEATALTFHHLIFITPKVLADQKRIDDILKNSSKDWEGFLFESGIKENELYQKLNAIKAGGPYPFTLDIYPNLTYEGMRDYYLKPEEVPSGYSRRCVSPWISAYVFPDGELKPCLNSSYSYGNIKYDYFDNVWNSRSAVEFRKLLKEEKIFPSCVKCTELFRY